MTKDTSLRSKDTKKRHIKLSDIKDLPATMSPREYAQVFGMSERYVQTLCQTGEIKAVQRKRGGRYYIPTAEALAANGIEPVKWINYE